MPQNTTVFLLLEKKLTMYFREKMFLIVIGCRRRLYIEWVQGGVLCSRIFKSLLCVSDECVREA